MTMSAKQIKEKEKNQEITLGHLPTLKMPVVM